MKIGWGFIGAGWIATTALAPAVHKTANAILQGVASRDLYRSSALEPVRVHKSYEDLIDDPEVDAIYISLANHLHLEWSIKALNGGKHVLCEKPLALNLKEAEMMFEAAAVNKKLLVEAIWMRWHPRFARTVQLVKSGAIGGLERISSAFTFQTGLEDNYRFSPEMGGGALLDLGPYQSHIWSALADQPFEFKALTASSHFGPTGVDLTTEVQGEINQRIQVSALASLERDGRQSLLITGDDGAIEFKEGEAFTSWKKESSLLVGGIEEKFPPIDPYSLMIESFGEHLSDESVWVATPKQSLQVMRTLDDISSLTKREKK